MIFSPSNISPACILGKPVAFQDQYVFIIIQWNSISEVSTSGKMKYPMNTLDWIRRSDQAIHQILAKIHCEYWPLS